MLYFRDLNPLGSWKTRLKNRKSRKILVTAWDNYKGIGKKFENRAARSQNLGSRRKAKYIQYACIENRKKTNKCDVRNLEERSERHWGALVYFCRKGQS